LQVVQDAKKALDEKAMADREKLIDEVLKEKVAGEMAQALVKKMLKSDVTKDTIAGEIDKILSDEVVKEAISKFYIDKPPIIGDEKEKQTSLRTKRQAI